MNPWGCPTFSEVDVIDTLDKSCQAQDVLGHSFAPLSTRLWIGERFTQFSRRVLQAVSGLRNSLELPFQRTVRFNSLLVDGLDDLAQFA